MCIKSVISATGGRFRLHDLRYAWEASENVELSITGQNLLDPRHPEYVAEVLTSEQMQAQRGIHLKARLQY